ncbi:MAG: MBL fold metallo-hydrolase [Saprospiraceae bacterium]
MKKAFPLLKPILLSCSFICFCLFSPNVIAQDRFAKVEITTERINDSLFVLKGAGGNIGLSIGADGVFMIYDQYAPLSEKIEKAIAKLTKDKVKYLINTHWHGDHTGGNENFRAAGAIVFAHENVYKRMSTDQLMKAFGRKVPASPAGALPMISFASDLHFNLNGEAILAFHLHNAHTDGDAAVYFTKSNVIHMGDTYFQNRFPFIDLSSGGSVDGLLKSINQVLFLIDDETVVIPGHGSLSTKKEMTAYRDVIMTVRDRVKMAIAKGMSLEEIQASNPSKEFDETWGSGFIKPAKFVDIIYTDLTKDQVAKTEEKE